MQNKNLGDGKEDLARSGVKAKGEQREIDREQTNKGMEGCVEANVLNKGSSGEKNGEEFLFACVNCCVY